MMHNNAIRQRRDKVSDEAEALQTDVMRFLAIICMCLMVVFSLVQSLPMSGEENRPEITTREMIQKEIESLSKKADQLKQTLMVLTHSITLKKAVARQALSDIQARVQQAMEKEQQFRIMAQKVENSLVARQMTLSRINDLVDKGRAALDAMESDLKEAKQALNQLGSAQYQQGSQKESRPGARQEETPVRPDDKEGFTLGFDSDEVLLQLLRQGDKVRLYMLSGGRCWQLKVKASGRVSFLPSPSPGTIYEMNRPTVPDNIIKAGKLVVAAFGTEGVTYGVELSPDISSRISRLMKEKKGGDLVILEKGEISLE